MKSYTISTPIKKTILNDLRDAIIKGEYKPGEHLTEAALCNRFKVSRTPVREALNQLEKEGLIKIIPNAGAKVVDLSFEDISDLFDMLIILEGAACRLAATKLGEQEIIKLEENLFLMKKAIEQNNLEFIDHLNTQFHCLITESTKNLYLIDIRSNFRALLNRVGHINLFVPGQLDATLKDHQKIIDALKSSNSVLAEFVSREHLEYAKKRLLEHLQTFLG